MISSTLVRLVNRLNPTTRGRRWLTGFAGSAPPGKYSIGNGLQMYFEPSDSTEYAMLHHCFEPMETKYFLNWLKPGMHVVDIGANIGYYTVQMHGRVGGSGKIWAFEANPRIFARLKQNVEANNAAEVTLMPMAAGNADGAVTLFCPADDTHGFASLRNQGWKAEEFVVPCRRIDDVLAGQRVDVLKLDVEGAEKMVLEGALDLIRSQKPRIMIELAPALTSTFGYRTFDLIDILLACNPDYAVRRLDAHGTSRVDASTFRQGPEPDGNYVFEPKR